MIYSKCRKQEIYMYRMLSMTEKVARVKGHVLKGNSLFFVSKSIGEHFAKPSSDD